MAQMDQVYWLVAENVARFRKMLISPRDETQRKQLEALLVQELAKLKTLPPDGPIADSGLCEATASPDLPETSENRHHD